MESRPNRFGRSCTCRRGSRRPCSRRRCRDAAPPSVRAHRRDRRPRCRTGRRSKSSRSTGTFSRSQMRRLRAYFTSLYDERRRAVGGIDERGRDRRWPPVVAEPGPARSGAARPGPAPRATGGRRATACLGRRRAPPARSSSIWPRPRWRCARPWRPTPSRGWRSAGPPASRPSRPTTWPARFTVTTSSPPRTGTPPMCWREPDDPVPAGQRVYALAAGLLPRRRPNACPYRLTNALAARTASDVDASARRTPQRRPGRRGDAAQVSGPVDHDRRRLGGGGPQLGDRLRGR